MTTTNDVNENIKEQDNISDVILLTEYEDEVNE